MAVCIICRFDVALDDIAITGSRPQRVVCLRCFTRETGTDRPLPRPLRQAVMAVLAAVDVAEAL